MTEAGSFTGRARCSFLGHAQYGVIDARLGQITAHSAACHHLAAEYVARVNWIPHKRPSTLVMIV